MFSRHAPINFKAIGIAFVVIVIIFAFKTCVVQAQLGGYFGNSPQWRVENALFRVNHAGELRLIRLLFNRGHELYGYYDRGPHGPRTFYPVLDRNGKPLNKRQRIERAAGIVGFFTGIGAVIDGKKGAGIGAILGSSVAAINDSRYRGGKKQQAEVYSPADPLPERGGVARKRPSRGVFTAPPRRYSESEMEWKWVRNEFESVSVRYYVGPERERFILYPGLEDRIQIPAGTEIWAEALIEDKNHKPRILVLEYGKGKKRLPQNSGWVFYNPYSIEGGMQ